MERVLANNGNNLHKQCPLLRGYKMGLSKRG
jgi:hypothetical protein